MIYKSLPESSLPMLQPVSSVFVDIHQSMLLPDGTIHLSCDIVSTLAKYAEATALSRLLYSDVAPRISNTE